MRINKNSDQIPKTFTQEQSEFFTGLMLGDGGLIWSKNRGYPRLSIGRQLKDKDYVFWQYNVFKDFYGTPPKYYKPYDKRTKKFYERYTCITKSGSLFTKMYNRWYPNNIKIVPRDLILNPFILLVWFLDDGCITKTSEHGLSIKLSTDGFTRDDTDYLAELLGLFIGEKINVYKNGSGWILKSYTLAAIKIIKIIDAILPECMLRKRTWKDYDWDYFNRNLDCFGDGVGMSDETKLKLKGRKGELANNAKINNKSAHTIRLLYNENYSIKDLSKIYSVSNETIRNIINNKSWTNIYNQDISSQEINEVKIKLKEELRLSENIK